MRIRSGLEGKRARIEIIPLLDVLLIVLIFLLYLALTSNYEQGVRVSLPEGSGHHVRASVTVVVTRDNHIVIGGKVVNIDAAVKQIEESITAQRRAQTPVVLRSDRASRLGLSVELLSRLRQAGFRNVSVEVEGR